MHRVFHGIRFKVKEIGCRDDNQFFYVDTSTTTPSPIPPIAIPPKSITHNPFLRQIFNENIILIQQITPSPTPCDKMSRLRE